MSDAVPEPDQEQLRAVNGQRGNSRPLTGRELPRGPRATVGLTYASRLRNR
jgi:hypothetical protein